MNEQTPDIGQIRELVKAKVDNFDNVKAKTQKRIEKIADDWLEERIEEKEYRRKTSQAKNNLIELATDTLHEINDFVNPKDPQQKV